MVNGARICYYKRIKFIYCGVNMKNVCIFVFSGTGMTQYVVDKIAQQFEMLDVKVDQYPIEKTQIQQVPFNTYDLLGIAYPVHAFNAPKIVINFAKQLPADVPSNVFLISTAGENNPVNYSSSKLLIKTLREKNYHVFYDKQLYMPSNFAVQYDESTTAAYLATATAKAPQIAQEITLEAFDRREGNVLSKCMHLIGRAEWFGCIFIGKLFYADHNCNHCGLCAKSCPNQNIISGAQLHFKWHCGLCMRCLYICPQHAIQVHQPFAFIKLGEWYKNEELAVSRNTKV